jgi:hypothetical protein
MRQYARTPPMSEPNLDRPRGPLGEPDSRPLHSALRERDDLRTFMRHHVFAWWGFLSRLKCLRGHIAPVQGPWLSNGNPDLRHFINRLVQGEESDIGPAPEGYASHFETYLTAMREDGADTSAPSQSLDMVRAQGADRALDTDLAPIAARYLCATASCFIREGKPHAATALAFGGDCVFPGMSHRLGDGAQWGASQAPTYQRHLASYAHRGSDLRISQSLQLLGFLCRGESSLISEVETAAEESLRTRIRFWDGVLDAMHGLDAQ